MLRAENLHKKFKNLPILKGVNLSVEPGEIVSIVGSSGAGKTTLLQILGTLLKADQGKLHYGNNEISSMKEKQLAAFRNQNIGFVFQFHHLLPEFTAQENVAIPGLIAGMSKSKAMERASDLLNQLELRDRLLHKPKAMSGGEQQRVATARALMNEPEIIFADEPSGNLDSKNAENLHQLFFQLRDEFKQSFIIVTHNPELSKQCDRQYEMKDGLLLNTT